jgi:hypothetical protein
VISGFAQRAHGRARVVSGLIVWEPREQRCHRTRVGKTREHEPAADKGGYQRKPRCDDKSQDRTHSAHGTGRDADLAFQGQTRGSTAHRMPSRQPRLETTLQHVQLAHARPRQNRLGSRGALPRLAHEHKGRLDKADLRSVFGERLDGHVERPGDVSRLEFSRRPHIENVHGSRSGIEQVPEARHVQQSV